MKIEKILANMEYDDLQSFTVDMMFSTLKQIVEVETGERILLLTFLRGIPICSAKIAQNEKQNGGMDAIGILKGLTSEIPVICDEEVEDAKTRLLKKIATIYPAIVEALQSDRMTRLTVKASYYLNDDNDLKPVLMLINQYYIEQETGLPCDFSSTSVKLQSVVKTEVFKKWAWAHMPKRDQRQLQEKFCEAIKKVN